MINIQIYIGDKIIREENLNSELKEIVIGRRPDHTIHLDNLAVSRDHALISISNALILEDLKSFNGTLLNGVPITKPVALNPNDVIQIAKFKLRIQDNRDPALFRDREPTTWLARTYPNGNAQRNTFEETGYYSFEEFQKDRDVND